MSYGETRDFMYVSILVLFLDLFLHSFSLSQIFLNKQPNPRKKLLVPCALDRPNPNCYVCAIKPEATIKLSVHKVTVQTLQDKVRFLYFSLYNIENIDFKKWSTPRPQDKSVLHRSWKRRFVSMDLNCGGLIMVTLFTQTT